MGIYRIWLQEHKSAETICGPNCTLYFILFSSSVYVATPRKMAVDALLQEFPSSVVEYLGGVERGTFT
ncbi:hypothetical protein IG631_23026 [Alternaria alternata]|nr:hypothetical protein IG631_23026 [Alternaria alternata]